MIPRTNPFDLPAHPVLTIKVDLHELAGAFVLRADLPGVRKRALHIDIASDLVSLRADLPPSRIARSDRIVVRERGYGTARRDVPLPAAVDAKAARTRYRDGVLTLTLPKLAPRARRKLAV